MEKLHYLRPTDLRIDCDACGAAFDLMTGGVCERCRRILCSRDLHGSWLMRMVHEYKRPVTCVDCRAGRTRNDAHRGGTSGAEDPGPPRSRR